MCGIFGIYKHPGAMDEDLRPLVEQLLLGAEERGKDACGLAYILGDTLYYDKDPVTPTEYVKSGRVQTAVDPKFSMLIGHTRHATQGTPQDNANNHPLISTDPPFVYGFVHNGVVYDRYAGKRPLLAEVDTEYIRATVADLLDAGKTFEDAIFEGIESLSGSMTTAWITPTSPNMIFSRKGNPLCFAHLEEKHITVFASTAGILTKALDTIVKNVITVFRPYSLWEPGDQRLIILQPECVRKRQMKEVYNSRAYKLPTWDEMAWNKDYSLMSPRFTLGDETDTCSVPKKKDEVRAGPMVPATMKIVPGDIVGIKDTDQVYIADYSVWEGTQRVRQFIDATGKKVVLDPSVLEVLIPGSERMLHSLVVWDRVTTVLKKKRYVGSVVRMVEGKKGTSVVMTIDWVDGRDVRARGRALTRRATEVTRFPRKEDIKSKVDVSPQKTYSPRTLEKMLEGDLAVYYDTEMGLLLSPDGKLAINERGEVVKPKNAHFLAMHSERIRHKLRVGDKVLNYHRSVLRVLLIFSRNLKTGQVDGEILFEDGEMGYGSVYNFSPRDLIFFPSEEDVEGMLDKAYSTIKTPANDYQYDPESYGQRE